MTTYRIAAATKRAATALALGATFALAACGSEAETVASAPEGVIEGVTIENARMVLAPVQGNPAAVYFDFSYNGDRAFSLGRVSVEGTQSAMMHQFGEYDFKVQMMEALPIPVTNGTKVEFKPGDYHVMAFEVSPDLKPGDTTEVTLTVSGGDKHKFTADIRAAGEER
ncbi:copper chaperone PCu(A)C [Qipengyuania sp. ASV99]|uniref:copper chaperone PCu(A)C n=1 Tax=Qipengyuania sp. ASV99 TaxID=3399681 RepID=UPI003A4C6977